MRLKKDSPTKPPKGAAKHTPGPWNVWPHHPAGFYVASNAENCPRVVHGIKSEADARLIAAAPDFLEAAKHLDEAWNEFITEEGGENGGMDRVGTAIVRLRAVIAKAERAAEEVKEKSE